MTLSKRIFIAIVIVALLVVVAGMAADVLIITDYEADVLRHLADAARRSNGR